MPLRSDPSLWYNLPGIVVAYQPLCAPNRLAASQNMGYAGPLLGKYTATPGTIAPEWRSRNGFIFTGSEWLKTGMVDSANIKTYIVAVRNCAVRDISSAMGVAHSSLYPQYYNRIRLVYGSVGVVISPAITSGVLAVTAEKAYRNGITCGNTGGTNFLGRMICLGANGENASGSSVSHHFAGDITAAAMFSRILSAAEVWRASRQMQYCDVNPDWSVWSPRRKWFPYVLAGGGFQAAWAAHSNSQVGTGVS